ncbi:MAG: endolytic transglycosylase MltG [Oscillospiraceae bacterium]
MNNDNNENNNETKKRIEFTDDIFKPGPPVVNRARNEKKMREYKKKQNKMYIAILGIVLAGIILAGGAFYVLKDVMGLSGASDEIEVEIPKGASVASIAEILEENGVVENSFWFRAYVKLLDRDATFNFGKYKVDKNASYSKIIYTFGQISLRTDIVTITFVEGMTQREYGELLEKNKVCTKAEFDEVLKTGKFDYKFMKYMSSNPLIYDKFEGYLFPDTYDFHIDEEPLSVANKLLSNFDSKMTDEIYAMIDEKKMNFDEVITLASIIQAEAGGTEQMYDVSSVFHNRLKNPDIFPNLESDVTIFYLQDDVEPFLDNPDDKMHDMLYNSYNTYEKVGIPIGPIGNPGMSAIDAAINPSDTDYFFFLTDKAGKFYYAVTANQHYRNDQIAKQINRTLANNNNGNK